MKETGKYENGDEQRNDQMVKIRFDQETKPPYVRKQEEEDNEVISPLNTKKASIQPSVDKKELMLAFFDLEKMK